MVQKRTLPLFASLLAFFVSVSAASSNGLYANDNRPKLTIGSKAPSIKIKHWLSMPNGFEQVQRFQKGKIYVVEFWATWCGPCRRIIPHMSKLADQYAEDRVQFIGVSDEDLSKVESFLSKKASKDGDETFEDYTSKYCLTCDPDGSVKKDIFRAAGRSGIPCAFIVGKQGLIEWIGHPSRIDKPLKQIVEGTWDRQSHKESFEREYRVKRNKRTVNDLIKKKKHNLAVNAIGKLLKDCEGQELVDWQLKMIGICLNNNLRRSEKEFKKIAKVNFKDPVMMNRMAWAVVDASKNGAEIEPEVLDLARKAIDLSVKSKRSAAALDTLAHIVELQGNLDEAIRIQTEAVEKADEKLRPELEEYLQSLKKET